METKITVPNECSITKVVSDHEAIARAAVETYRRSLDKLLVSVRLLGSAARGESALGSSDINFVGLASMSPDAYQRDTILVAARKLTLAYRCVSTVDLETEIKGRVSPSREFIFRTDSVCIWGVDDYTAADVTISNTALSKLTTPDFNKLMAGYRQQLRSPMNMEELSRFGRSVGKDMLKCFRKYLVLRLGVYRKSAADIHNQLLMYFPQKKETFNCLLQLYEQPVVRRDELLQILKMAQASYESFEQESA